MGFQNEHHVYVYELASARTLSPTGDPTLKTLRSVIYATGFKFYSLEMSNKTPG